jgi:hypothetical protein
VRTKIISIILAFIFFLGAVTFYVNQVIIPRHLKTIITNTAEKYLGRHLTFKRIRFNPLRGFLIDGIAVFEKDSQDPFATIDKAVAGFRYLPLIFEKKIVLSSFEVHKVSAHLIHYAADQWNFSDLRERLAEPHTSSSKSVPVYLSHIQMTDGKIKVTDLEAGSQSSEFFDDVQIKSDLSWSRGIIFEMGTRIPSQQGWFEAKGRYQLLSKKFKAQVKMKNIPLAQYVKLSRQTLPVTFEDAYVHDLSAFLVWDGQHVEAQGFGTVRDLNLKLSPENSLQARAAILQKSDFSFNNGQMNISGIGQAQNVKVVFGPRIYSTADAKAELTGLSIHDNMLLATGNAELQKAAVEIPDHPSFQADLTLNNLRVAQDKDNWTATGLVHAQKTMVVFSPEAKLTGDFSSPSLAFVIAPKTETIKGDVEAQDMFLQWPTDKELRGTIDFKDVTVNGGDQLPWTGQGNLSGKAITIKLPAGHTFTTDATSTVSFKMQTSPHKVDVQSDFQLAQSVFTWASGISFKGDPVGKLQVHTDEKPDTPAAYEGTFKLENAVLEGTHIGTIDGVKGEIAFKNDFASTNALGFGALGMTARLKGKLQDFGKPSADVKIHIDQFDLTQAPKIATRFFEQSRLSLQGTGEDVDISYRGPITDAANADIRFTATLKDAAATSSKLNQTASKLSGRVDYRKDFFAWKNLKALYGERSYVLTGKLTSFEHPSVETTVTSRNMKLTTRFDYGPDLITIKKLTGVYEHMIFDVKGTSRPSKDNPPILDLSGDLDVDLKYLPLLLPHWDVALKPLPFDGDLKIKGQFQGDPVHWQDWKLNLTGSSSQFVLWGLKLRSMRFNLIEKDSRLKPLHVWGNFYGGEFNTITSVDFARKDLPFDFIIKIENTDLGAFKEDTPLKKQNIDGKLSLTALLEGSASDFKTVHGKGGVKIAGGRLWELDLLKGLGGILLIPEYKDIVFNEAGMNFTVGNQKVSTDNLQLLSKSLTLIGRGTMDFDQNLDLVLSPDFNSDVIAGSPSLKKGSTAIIAETQKFMSVDVTGTLTSPQYKVNKSPARILQKTGGVILENVSGFFKNIF